VDIEGGLLMKQSISPAVAVVAILIIVVLVAAIGYFVTHKGKSGSGPPKGAAGEKEMMQKSFQQMEGQGGGSGAQGGSTP
jgi:Tfp pilus assembly protein PilO